MSCPLGPGVAPFVTWGKTGPKTQDLVDFGLWGFESPLSHQQLSFDGSPRRPFLVCRLVCQTSSRDVDNAPPSRTRLVACRTVAGGPPKNLGRPSLKFNSPERSPNRGHYIVPCCTAHLGVDLVPGSSKLRNSKVVSERAPLRGEPTANLRISLGPEELSVRESLSWPSF